MEQTHLHLFITHLPLFGVLLGLIVLLVGIARKSPHTLEAAFYVLVIATAGAIIAYVTGEAAEETVEHLPGVTESAIEAHEEAGKFVLISFIPLGLIALTGLFFPARRWTRYIPGIAVILCLLSFAAAFNSASLGGKIRHTELNGSAVPKEGNEETETESHEEASAPVVMPAGGGKWLANAETKTGIDNMLQSVNDTPSEPTPEQLADLQKDLESEFQELINKCTMTGEAHDQLHNYLLPLREMIRDLDTEPADESLPSLASYLKSFKLYFE